MNHLTLGTSVLVLTTSLAGVAPAQEDVTAWRLFVSDHAEPVVRVIDAVERKRLTTLDINGPAALYRSDSGAAVYAVQGEADLVTTIKSGISFHDHGDHADIAIDDPTLTGAHIAGDYPVHLVEHGGQWAAFFDNEGVARVFAEAGALEGRAETREVDSGAPHHGVVVPWGKYDLVSEPHPEDPSNLPVGIKVLDRDGNQLGELAECPDLHGEASSGNQLAFACATGLLVVESAGAGAPAIEHLAYADTLPEGKTTTLIGGRGLQYFLGNYGAAAVVLIDVSDGDAFRYIELPTRRVTFAVDPVRARFAYVFTEDGKLHQLDVIAGMITNSLALTEPYSMDGHWSDPRPRVAVAGDHVVVTDPLAGKLRLVNAASFESDGEIDLGGTPFNIVAVGGTGTRHHAERNAHGHEEHDEKRREGGDHEGDEGHEGAEKPAQG